MPIDHSDADYSSLTELADKAFQAIGPSRIAALTLYIISQETGYNIALYSRASKRIAKANAMLTSELQQGLSDLEHMPSDAFIQAQKCALRTLEKLTRVGPPSSGDQASALDPEMLRQLCLIEVDEQVTQFLILMMQELRAEQSHRAKLQKAQALKSVHQAEQVGKSIHLVAINASIEAARAGDGGRGFKVIAEEIQRLATRTQGLLTHVSDTMRNI